MQEAQLHKDLTGLVSAIKELQNEVRATREDRNHGNSSSIHIDAGGAATWFSSRIAAYCCVFLVGLSIGLTGMVVMGWTRLSAVESSVNANKAYLSAIFQKAPELKAEIDKAKGSKHEHDRSRADGSGKSD